MAQRPGSWSPFRRSCVFAGLHLGILVAFQGQNPFTPGTEPYRAGSSSVLGGAGLDGDGVGLLRFGLPSLPRDATTNGALRLLLRSDLRGGDGGSARVSQPADSGCAGRHRVVDSAGLLHGAHSVVWRSCFQTAAPSHPGRSGSSRLSRSASCSFRSLTPIHQRLQHPAGPALGAVLLSSYLDGDPWPRSTATAGFRPLPTGNRRRWVVFGLVVWLGVMILQGHPLPLLQNLPPGTPLPAWAAASGVRLVPFAFGHCPGRP